MAFDMARFLGIISVVGPAVLMSVPGGMQYAPLIPLIISGITTAETKPLTNEQKRAYVLSLVSDAIAGTNIVKPGTIDMKLAMDTAGSAVDAVVGVVRIVQAAQAKHPNVPTTVAPPETITVLPDGSVKPS